MATKTLHRTLTLRDNETRKSLCRSSAGRLQVVCRSSAGRLQVACRSSAGLCWSPAELAGLCWVVCWTLLGSAGLCWSACWSVWSSEARFLSWSLLRSQCPSKWRGAVGRLAKTRIAYVPAPTTMKLGVRRTCQGVPAALTMTVGTLSLAWTSNAVSSKPQQEFAPAGSLEARVAALLTVPVG